MCFYIERNSDPTLVAKIIGRSLVIPKNYVGLIVKCFHRTRSVSVNNGWSLVEINCRVNVCSTSRPRSVLVCASQSVSASLTMRVHLIFDTITCRMSLSGNIFYPITMLIYR